MKNNWPGKELRGKHSLREKRKKKPGVARNKEYVKKKSASKQQKTQQKRSLMRDINVMFRGQF